MSSILSPYSSHNGELDEVTSLPFNSRVICRVSKGDADEIQNSLRSQKSEIIKLASRLNIKEDAIQWFVEEEARSAYSERSDWAMFERAIEEACTNHGIKYFLDFSQERFCRNRTRSPLYKGRLQRANVDLRFASGDVENPDSLEGFVLDCTNEMVAEMYSRKVGADTLRGCKENAITRDKETGYAFKNGGAAPFWLKSKKVVVGTDKSGEDIKKTIWVENDTIHTANVDGKLVSKTIWEWARYHFIDLRLKQKLGIERARDILNELEIPAPRKQYWATSCLYEAEKSEALIGIGTYNKKQFARNGNGRTKDKSEWIIVENAHPGLLSEDEFEALKCLRAQYVCSWKPEYQLIRVSSARVISWISQKGEFCRSELEKALGLNDGQAYWFIKDLIKKGQIKRTNKFVNKIGKGQRQVIYKYIK